MKYLSFLFALVISCAAPLARAQTSVTYSPERYWNSQCNPVYDLTTGAITALPWTAHFQQAGSDGTTRVSPLAPDLLINLLPLAAKTVTFTFQGQPVTLPYGEILLAAQAMIAQERAAQIAALPPPPSP